MSRTLKSKGIPGLRKAQVFWAGFWAIVLIAGLSIFKGTEETSRIAIGSLVWIIGLGLGVQLLDSVQKSVWYRPDFDKKEEPKPE